VLEYVKVCIHTDNRVMQIIKHKSINTEFLAKHNYVFLK